VVYGVGVRLLVLYFDEGQQVLQFAFEIEVRMFLHDLAY
jgi:hypothetical protein